MWRYPSGIAFCRGSIMIRASTMAAPVAVTCTGLSSISRAQGSAQTSVDSWSSILTSGSRSAAGNSRNAPRYFAVRVPAMRSSARRRLSGGSITAFSRSTAALSPPLPNVMIGPNTGSVYTPIATSRACGSDTIFCTATP